LILRTREERWILIVRSTSVKIGMRDPLTSCGCLIFLNWILSVFLSIKSHIEKSWSWSWRCDIISLVIFVHVPSCIIRLVLRLKRSKSYWTISILWIWRNVIILLFSTIIWKIESLVFIWSFWGEIWNSNILFNVRTSFG
jgi:hypothetical protein